MEKRINIITMGCSKNLVDSERLMRQLDAAGIRVLHDAPLDKAPVVVVNTCGFINSAREESVNMILQCVDALGKGVIRQLYVMGCLAEVYREQLQKEIPEVSRFFGVNSMEEIVKTLTGGRSLAATGERIITTPAHYAYLKIAEGCDRRCSFCSIPLIRGKHLSVPIDALVEEAQRLADGGVKELLVVSQDTTYYGIDLQGRSLLPELIKRLSLVEGLEWIRLHYTYPLHFPMELLTLMRDNPKVCRYLDMPVQHISTGLLSSMKRGITGEATRELIEHIRREVPDIALRTTLIVGHPGETEDDFEQLLDFVRTTQFDKLGVFTYSHEDNTYAGQHYKDTIPQRVKQERADRIMAAQQEISEQLLRCRIGQSLRCIIDRCEGDLFIARTEYDSPEVDSEVLITTSAKLTIGDFYTVRITDASEYDLYGQVE